MKRNNLSAIYVALVGLLCPGAAQADDWGGDAYRQSYVWDVLGQDPAELTPGDAPIGTTVLGDTSTDKVIMWGKDRDDSSNKPLLSVEYRDDSYYLIPSTTSGEDWATVGGVYHYTYPIQYAGKDAVLSIRFIRQGDVDVPDNIPTQNVYNIVMEVFTYRDVYSRMANSAPDFTWIVNWDNDILVPESSDCVNHPLMLCPIESKFFMREYLTPLFAKSALHTDDNTGSERRRNDIFATTFDLVTYDANNSYNGSVDGTDEVFLFADEYVWVFNLSSKKIICQHLKTCGTHFEGEETFPDTYADDEHSIYHVGVNSSVDYIKGGYFSFEPITWGATHFNRPKCDGETVATADLDGIFAIAHAAGDKYFGIWVPQGDTSRIFFRYLGHKSCNINRREQDGGYTHSMYTTIDLVAHEVTPYNTVYCESFDSSTSTPSNILEDKNEKEHFAGDPVLLFAWTDFQYFGITTTTIKPSATTYLLLLPTDTDVTDSTLAESTRSFTNFLNGGDFWTEYFSKNDYKANYEAAYSSGTPQTVLTRPEIGVFRPSADVPCSMILFNNHFFTYAAKRAGASKTELQYYYELTDQDGNKFTDDLFRVTGNPVVNDLADSDAQKLWFLAWVEDSSNQRNYDWQLFNIGCKWVDTGDTKDIDGTTGHALRLAPVIDWGKGIKGYGNMNGASAGIAPYQAPYPILEYKRSYVNATNPTLIWTVSAPPLDADNGLTWYQYAYDAPTYTQDAISCRLPQ